MSKHDFDFLFGDWKMHHRRLRERLAGCDEWEEFGGRSTVRPLLDGIGNYDEVWIEEASGYHRGMSLRLYDTASEQWSIYWANERDGRLEPPVIGGFVDGRGEFYGHETFRGRWIYTRFTWSDITDDSAEWRQAFSSDGGKAWETNWIMRMTRA